MTRLKRLHELVPPGSLRDQTQMALLRLTAESKLEDEFDLEQLKKRRDKLSEMFNQGCDLMSDLAQRIEQDSPEYDRCFADWLQLKDAYEEICDRIICIEARMQYAHYGAVITVIF